MMASSLSNGARASFTRNSYQGVAIGCFGLPGNAARTAATRVGLSHSRRVAHTTTALRRGRAIAKAASAKPPALSVTAGSTTGCPTRKAVSAALVASARTSMGCAKGAPRLSEMNMCIALVPLDAGADAGTLAPSIAISSLPFQRAKGRFLADKPSVDE